MKTTGGGNKLDHLAAVRVCGGKLWVLVVWILFDQLELPNMSLQHKQWELKSFKRPPNSHGHTANPNIGGPKCRLKGPIANIITHLPIVHVSMFQKVWTKDSWRHLYGSLFLGKDARFRPEDFWSQVNTFFVTCLYNLWAVFVVSQPTFPAAGNNIIMVHWFLEGCIFASLQRAGMTSIFR